VQVVTSVGGPALSGITKVFAGGSNSFAADASGNLWAWGAGMDGVLGTGSTVNSPFATRVLAASGGAQFTGVDQLAVDYTGHACAHRTDGTVWCWGDNVDGEIGVGTSTSNYPFPTQVTALLASALSVTVDSHVSCAVTGDGSVWCWGTNVSGQLGNGTNSGTSNVPVQVLVSTGGTPFTGASEAVLLNQSACALKAADRSIWCWGSYLGSLTPSQWTEMNNPVSGVFFLGRGNTTPSFIARDGTLHSGGLASTAQVTNAVTCP
jgi:alpha-tubulin suppressor-like RCC1 family protein